MKKLSIFIVAFATLAFASCSSLSGSSSSESAAKTSGRNTATAILSLYNSYRATGNVSLNNATNLTNALVLASGYSNMRANSSNPEYRKAFAAGMVSAGTGLITAANVETVIGTMNNLTGLNVNAATISNSVNTATAIVQLLQVLGTPAQ